MIRSFAGTAVVLGAVVTAAAASRGVNTPVRATVGGGVVGTANTGGQAARDTPATSRSDGPGVSEHLMLDKRVIERVVNARLVLGKVSKEPRNPLFVEAKPWGVRFDNLYPNVLFDEKERLYKCWYNPFIVCEATTNTPPDKRKSIPYRPKKREMAICYATSKDGIVWDKPDLGVVEFNGSRANNLVLRDVHGAGVYRDDHDSNADRRYKVFAAGGVAFSPDGIHWSAFRPCPAIKAAGDTHNNAFWDERSGRYVGITRLWKDGQRIVGRTESVDFVHWTPAAEVLRGTRERQTYAMLVFPCAGAYLGLVMILDGKTDCVDCELAWSPDTIQWERICEGTPLIPRGPKGSFDYGCIYAASPVRCGGEIRLYYGGGDDVHMSWRKTGLGLARLRVDGFAGMEPADPGQPGRIVTKPLRCSGRRLRVNADASAGSLRVAVADVPGRDHEACKPIVSNVTNGIVEWSGGESLEDLRGQTIQLVFELRSARLYAFGFSD
jgi:hypothetical protein